MNKCNHITLPVRATLVLFSAMLWSSLGFSQPIVGAPIARARTQNAVTYQQQNTPAIQTQQAPNAKRWEIKATDASLSRALLRWARESNVQMVWEAPKDKPAIQAAYQGSLEEVVAQVMEDTSVSEYQLHACGYDNVIRILHISQSCKR